MPDETSNRLFLSPEAVANLRFTGTAAERANLNFAAAAAPVRFDIDAPAPIITRGGRELPVVRFDPSVLDNIFVPPPRIEQVRVVGQNPPAGTRLPRGATVDLILAPVGEIPFDVFTQPHTGFKGRTVGDFEDVLTDPKVRDILNKYTDAAAVSQADRQVLTERLRSEDVVVDDADPQRSFDLAFRTVRDASVFG